MNLSQRLLQTLAISYFFYTSVPFELLILIVKIKNKKKMADLFTMGATT